MRISDWISDVCSSDLALGVTLCRLFTGSFPYGEAEAFSRPRFGKPKPPSASRDDLPAWLDDIILRAVATSPNARFGDVVEMLHALEGGPVIAPARALHFRPLIERNPLLFWQGACLILVILLIASLATRG